MMSVLLSLLLTLRDSACSRVALQLEVLALRHQLQVLQRTRPPRLRLVTADRWLWVWLSRTWSGWRTALVMVKPETVITWHRRGFRSFWTWRSRRRTGRPTVPRDVRALIRTMSEANPLWGAPRIHGELLKLGIEVGQASVAKYMVRRRPPPSQTWRSFLRNHMGQIMAADFFVVPTATYRFLFVLIVLAHDRRRVVHLAVTAHPTAMWTAQQLRDAFPWDQAPRFLLHDRDHAFDGVTATAMGMHEVLTAPRSPWQIILHAAGLRRVLKAYVQYYTASRTHLELTHSAAHHLLAIHEVGSKYGGWARVSDIARQLDITRGSVSINLRALKKRGWVRTGEHHMVTLSPKGLKAVQAIIAKRVVVKAFLSQVLGTPEPQAEIDSCKIEHLISHATGHRLIQFMRFLTSGDAVAAQVLARFRRFEQECPESRTCDVCQGHCLVDELGRAI